MRADGNPVFFDLSSWRKVLVSGDDARGWLNDLLSADVSQLTPGSSTRSLLLSPTGRIRAEFTVAATDEGFLLIQDPGQRRAIDALLSPYGLSSAVSLQDRTGAHALFAIPGVHDAPIASEAIALMPSTLGPGVDLLAPSVAHAEVARSLATRYAAASAEHLEAWRIVAGRPRFGLDISEEDLPQEAGLGDSVAFDKGCYLGQEAIAKVRNLGHPRRLLVLFEATGPASAGEVVVVEGREAGRITSVAPSGRAFAVLARIRWDDRRGPFLTAGGIGLTPRRGL